MKSSHGVIQGYTGEAMLDEKNQVIVCAEAFGSSHEQELVYIMFNATEENMHRVTNQNDYLKGKTVLADNGNFSESNLKYLEGKGINAYIPDNNFRQRNERLATAKRHVKTKKEDYYRQDKFWYDENADCYDCPNGEVLKRSGKETMIRNRYLGTRLC
jgi:hypothetical protein